MGGSINLLFWALLTAIGPFRINGPTALAGPLPVQHTLTADQLSSAVAANLQRVEEFQLIREQAAQMQARVWLFGGTAASFVHYVKGDLRRQMGDNRYLPERFDYEYSNIFRSTQDLDIVLDGTQEQVRELQKKLEEKYKYFQGLKTKWEVRTLKHPMGTPGAPGFKEALLEDWNFLNQNSDSHSTGMVEISRSGEPVVRDLRDWNSPQPVFLNDALNSEIHYYFSPSHEKTTRARQGTNPPLISVIRYLIKAFQFELRMDKGSAAIIQGIIDRFDPRKDLSNPVVLSWMRRNVPKLYLSAVNMEHAEKTLEKLGLKKKLLAVDDPEREGTIAWWMGKKPLPSKKIGAGLGPTAAELGITVVAHQTSDFLAYESICASPTGEPNVFESRSGIAGERAAHGRGFYTARGTVGEGKAPINIRFQVNPEAREGTDFKNQGRYVIFFNKAAFRIVPESLSMSLSDYLRQIDFIKKLEQTDQGVLERLRRQTRIRSASPEELIQAEAHAAEEMKKQNPNQYLLLEWARLAPVAESPDSFALRMRILERWPDAASMKKLIDWPLRDAPWSFSLKAQVFARHSRFSNFEKLIQYLEKHGGLNHEDFTNLLEGLPGIAPPGLNNTSHSDQYVFDIFLETLSKLPEFNEDGFYAESLASSWFFKRSFHPVKSALLRFMTPFLEGKWDLPHDVKRLLNLNPHRRQLWRLSQYLEKNRREDMNPNVLAAYLMIALHECGPDCGGLLREALIRVKDEDLNGLATAFRAGVSRELDDILHQLLIETMRKLRFTNPSQKSGGLIRLATALLNLQGEYQGDKDLLQELVSIALRDGQQYWDSDLTALLGQEKWAALSEPLMWQALEKLKGDDLRGFLSDTLTGPLFIRPSAPSESGYFSNAWNSRKLDLYRACLRRVLSSGGRTIKVNVAIIPDVIYLVQHIPEPAQLDVLQILLEETAHRPEIFGELQSWTLRTMQKRGTGEHLSSHSAPVKDEYFEMLKMAVNRKPELIGPFFKKHPGFQGLKTGFCGSIMNFFADWALR